jgi:hypothetical protein
MIATSKPAIRVNRLTAACLMALWAVALIAPALLAR